MSITTALEARRDALRDREAGFTLIELLVVVLIIGILAAIAIPIYIGVQNNAKDSGVQSDLAADKTAVVAFFTNNPSATTLAIPPAAGSELAKDGFTYDQTKYSLKPTFATGYTSTNWCINATSAQNTKFFVSTNVGVQKGSCGASGTW